MNEASPSPDGRQIWVFNSDQAASVFPCGVWSSRERAEQWIAQVGASGTLSAYILDESAYDSNVRLGQLRLDLGKQDRYAVEYERTFTTAIDHSHFP